MILPTHRKHLVKSAAVALSLLAASALLLTSSAADNRDKSTQLRHVVAFKFKETTTPEDIKKVETAFRALKKKIPQIADLEWGTNNSPEKHDKGFTHCFILTFKSEKDRDDYLPHPDHKEFGKIVGPLLADVFVVDFWAKP